MIHHVAHLRNKPEHVRKSIALGVAAGATAVVALGWGAATIGGGSLALIPSDIAPSDAPAQLAAAARETSSSVSSLLGAVGAAKTDSIQSGLQIVDGDVHSTITTKEEAKSAASAEQTVIPF